MQPQYGRFRVAFVVLLVAITFLLSSCSYERNITITLAKDFSAEIKTQYKDINKCRIYKGVGANGVVIEYVIKEDMLDRDKEECLEVTKQWICQEDNLKEIEKFLENISIRGIEVRFRSSVTESYNAYYYKMGPDGYQDSRYWTEDNKDNFQTWFYSES